MNENEKIPNQVLGFLTALYGTEKGEAAYAALYPRLMKLVEAEQPHPAPPLSERDAFVITYGDQVRREGQPPLRTLAEFCKKHLSESITGIHILPFFPYSSDDGFSVIDYRKVDPLLGEWEDIHTVGQNFRLMFDAVINHISCRSDWFQKFLEGDPRYQGYFITLPPDTDLSQVARPRTHPLLTAFSTNQGVKYVWTTFSADQVDLDVTNPAVMVEIIDILLFYIAHGAQAIRLDAIAYLWKEVGTNCIHHPKTHWAVRLMRAVLDVVAPHTILITETNVPHKDNISYFGNGFNEAQLVYNFVLPPLLLYTFYTENAQKLSTWAAGLTLPTRRVTFFNFLASHDGVGLNPVRSILGGDEIDAIIQACTKRGGLISTKSNSDGSESAYEININYFDALSDPGGEEPVGQQVDRFITAHAILLSLAGVPGIYVHSLFGSRGWRDGPGMTGMKRSINRQKFDYEMIEPELSDPGSLRSKVFDRFTAMLKVRAGTPAFDPYGAQILLELGNSLFTVMRIPPDLKNPVVCIHNISRTKQAGILDLKNLGLKTGKWINLIDRRIMKLNSVAAIDLDPYQTLWLEKLK